MTAISASHSRAADSTSVSSTACRSKVERLMTLSTSAVAVCCCSDSRSSLSRRVFSMAMTASTLSYSVRPDKRSPMSSETLMMALPFSTELC